MIALLLAGCGAPDPEAPVAPRDTGSPVASCLAEMVHEGPGLR